MLATAPLIDDVRLAVDGSHPEVQQLLAERTATLGRFGWTPRVAASLAAKAAAAGPSREWTFGPRWILGLAALFAALIYKLMTEDQVPALPASAIALVVSGTVIPLFWYARGKVRRLRNEQLAELGDLDARIAAAQATAITSRATAA